MENSEVQSALDSEGQTEESVPEQLLIPDQPEPVDTGEVQLKAIVEAVVYITDEPLSAGQIAAALQQPVDRVARILEELAAEYGKPEHGLTIREIAGGYKISTKAEHHEAIRAFVKNLNPPLKLSLAALETLSLIAYKQPITAPEIMEIRGVQGAGVLKTLLDRKLIATSGRKQVLGKPILYKTTKEFLVQFGLKDLSELPTLKEFEELGRLSLGDFSDEAPAAQKEMIASSEAASEPTTDPATEEPNVT
jgi:segregation and condensation protein B